MILFSLSLHELFSTNIIELQMRGSLEKREQKKSKYLFILILPNLSSFIKMQFKFALCAQLVWRQRNNIRKREKERERKLNLRILAHVNAIISEFGGEDFNGRPRVS